MYATAAYDSILYGQGGLLDIIIGTSNFKVSSELTPLAITSEDCDR